MCMVTMSRKCGQGESETRNKSVEKVIYFSFVVPTYHIFTGLVYSHCYGERMDCQTT